MLKMSCLTLHLFLSRSPHGFLRAFLALRHRNFRLFFYGQLISLIGTWMQSIGQSWLVLEMTHSAFLLGRGGSAAILAGVVPGTFRRRPGGSLA